jgi:hypothetical protein
MGAIPPACHAAWAAPNTVVVAVLGLPVHDLSEYWSGSCPRRQPIEGWAELSCVDAVKTRIPLYLSRARTAHNYYNHYYNSENLKVGGWTTWTGVPAQKYATD